MGEGTLNRRGAPSAANVWRDPRTGIYNTFRPHSALGYMPPAPEAVMLAEDPCLSWKTG